MQHRISSLLSFLVFAAAASAANLVASDTPPWNREPALKEAAKSVVIEGTLDPRDPSAGGPEDRGYVLSNPQVRSQLWGTADRLTVSLLKTDVWDRRYGSAPTVTLEQIKAGVDSPANQGFDDMPPHQRRPVRGYLLPQGGRFDPYACWNAYPFPCQKPVGQIILGMDGLGGAPAPMAVQHCDDGTIVAEMKGPAGHAHVEIALSMSDNVFAIRGTVEGGKAPWLRLYRHVDQAYLKYMTADKKGYLKGPTGVDFAKDAARNGPVEPPESGTDGRFFWIHQKLPAEKTFPKGFDYVLMGLSVTAPARSAPSLQDGKGLGTAPDDGGSEPRLTEGYRAIREAPGTAATASLGPDSSGRILAFVTVVTCNDAADPFAEAKSRLARAASLGFEGIEAANRAWYAALYDQRENGREFFGDSPTAASEPIARIFTSWACSHGGFTRPDMRHFEATASYAAVEQDWQPWHSLPCYNELFYTPTIVRNRADSIDLWWKLMEAWLPAAEANAKEVYAAQGSALVHGYLPPIKPDRYVHTNCALEFCIDTQAQMVKTLWDQWDYSGDQAFLKAHAYPAIRDAAQFFASYATLGSDGRYHFIPSLEAEAWGLFPGFARARDTISSLSMARWTLERAAEGAARLGVDQGLAVHWLEVSRRLADYPQYEGKGGALFNSVGGTVPSWKHGDHPWYIGFYPTDLADEITLDSSELQKAEMIRTARAIGANNARETLALLGVRTQENLERAALADPEILLNSRSGRIHLFPAVAAGEIVAFRRMQARGGFLVSAEKTSNNIQCVEIEARLDGDCRLANPWSGRAVAVVDRAGAPVAIESPDRESILFHARAGEDYRLAPVSAE